MYRLFLPILLFPAAVFGHNVSGVEQRHVCQSYPINERYYPTGPVIQENDGYRFECYEPTITKHEYSQGKLSVYFANTNSRENKLLVWTDKNKDPIEVNSLDPTSPISIDLPWGNYTIVIASVHENGHLGYSKEKHIGLWR